MNINKINFKNQEKKLKNHIKEQEILSKIIVLLKESKDLKELSANPICFLYNFEALKDDLFGFYSFNLSKNGGTIRLICSFNSDGVNLEYISLNHYADFKQNLKINKERKIKV